jgi:GT2 family glycosyltransferase
MSPVELSIIIVNWNSADYVLNCIRSVYEQTPSLKYEIIVVDNGSFDECGKRLEEEYSWVKFIQSSSNLGFGQANNLGASNACAQVLLFLNPDTELKERAIEDLYQEFQKLNNPGVVGCRLLNSDGSLQTSCVQSLPTVLNQVLDSEVLRRWFPKSSLWGNAVLFENTSIPTEVEAISGACMMIKKEKFNSLGGFSPEYFMYGEDLDICFKTRRAGLINYHLGGILIIHHGGGSTQKARSDFSVAMMRESVFRFIRKSGGLSQSAGYRLSMGIAAVIRSALLGAAFPVYLVKNNLTGWRISLRKWLVIFRWAIGLEKWTKSSDRVNIPSAKDKGKELGSCAASAEN